MFKCKSSIRIGAKVEISPKGFTLGVKADIEKSFSICPKLLLNVEHYGLVLAPRLKKGYHQIWEANLQPLRPMFRHLIISNVLAFISNLGPICNPKMFKVSPKVFWP
jgi:hypothetical protein